ncbi:MAG: EAL domain-containing protein [Oscillospiraceae bacterium]|nr:EAL domain-containing protein [Oscillospiraceae bacterium]
MSEKEVILMANDSAQNRDLLVAMLEDLYEIIEATDVKGTIEKIEKNGNRLRLIILDLQEPNSDGLEVLRYMKENKSLDIIPVIMISNESMDEAYAMGVAEFFRRPFRSNVIRHRVKNTIRLYKKQSQYREELRRSNQRYLDTIRSMESQVLYAFHINLTRNYAELMSNTGDDLGIPSVGINYDELVSVIAQKVLAEDREKFTSKLSGSSLIQSWNDGIKNVCVNFGLIPGNSRGIKKLSATVGIMENTTNHNVEAIINIIDIYAAYRSRRIEKLLFEYAYESVLLLDLETGRLMDYKAAESHNDEGSLTDWDYELYRHNKAISEIADEDRNLFLHASSIPVIKGKLASSNRFIFVTRSHTGNGKLQKHTFCYLDKRKDTIVITLQDYTKEQELDSLTGELSRVGFVNCVESYINNVNEDLSLLYINIRNFKAINSEFTIHGGDEILRLFIAHLKGSDINPIFTGRVESDHFICLANSSELNFASISSSLHMDYKRCGKSIPVNCTCGIYHIRTSDLSVNEMIDNAKLALNGVENEFVTPYAEFDITLHSKYLQRAKIVTDIEGAINRGEFSVFYQPIYDAVTRKIVSAEALVRWISPEIGHVLPSTLFDVLEANGQVALVDLFIARRVEQMLCSRWEKGKAIVPVSINLSRSDFHNEGLTGEIIHMLNNSPVPAAYHRYELTESSYASFNEEHSAMLKKLADNGATILLDDFGSGFSSFSTLKADYFDILKLDLSFTKQIEKSDRMCCVISSIIDMSHKLGMKVIAEGVETDAQIDFLAKNGCDYIQGYYFSKPVSADEFAGMLDELR